MAAPSTAPSGFTLRDHPRRVGLGTAEKVGLLIAGIMAAAGVMIDLVGSSPGLDAPIQLPLIAMIVVVYVAESALVHLEFGGQAHSFSLSEFALILGLFFADPLDLIMATAIGSLMVLIINRRQPLLKMLFNLAQFTLQAALAVFVFQTYASFGDPLGPFGWAGAILAMLAALLVSDVLINMAIRISGGEISIHEQLEAFGITALAALLNTSMALVAVIVLWLQPAASWLAVVPPVALFVAYRAYMSQRVQQQRFRMLYQATRELHGTPRIEHALASAASSLNEMLNAERSEIYLLDTDSNDIVWVTSAGPGEEREVSRRSAESIDDTEPWRKAMATGQALQIDNGNSNGAVASPLSSTDGAVIGAVVVSNRLGDVTGFTAGDLRTLSTFAAQVGATISNNRLIKSLASATALAKEREALIKAKDDFIASVSHELRTPLTTVLGLSQELVSHEVHLEQAEREELVELIADQSNELSHLVDDLLVSARSDIGTLHINTEALDLHRELATVLRENCETDAIPILGEPGIVWGDGLRLRQIIRNLIVNARRYGGETVRIEIDSSGSHVVLAVVDNGRGVPEGMEDSIFDAYGRAHHPGSQPGSIGLGLHVARRLAERMSGTLKYRRAGDETRFELTMRSVAAAPVGTVADMARAIS